LLGLKSPKRQGKNATSLSRLLQRELTAAKEPATSIPDLHRPKVSSVEAIEKRFQS